MTKVSEGKGGPRIRAHIKDQISRAQVDKATAEAQLAQAQDQLTQVKALVEQKSQAFEDAKAAVTGFKDLLVLTFPDEPAP